MPFASEITLSKETIPTFPDKCLVCHKKPDSTAKIAHHSRNSLLAFLLPILMLFGWSTLEIPICKKCKPKYRFQRWGRDIAFLVFASLAIWWLYPMFDDMTGLARKAAIGGLALLVLTPYIMWEVFWPRIFDTTAKLSSTTYEFFSVDYASEFLSLNEDDVVAFELEKD